MKIRSAILAMAFCSISASFALGSACTSQTTQFIVGWNDNPGTPTSYEKPAGDLQDSVEGICSTSPISVTSTTPTATFQNVVTPDSSSNVFWNNPSLDAPGQNANVVNFVLENGFFTGDSASPDWTMANTQALQTSSGGAAESHFSSTTPITVTLLARISSLTGVTSLGYDDLSTPNNLITLFADGQMTGSATFTCIGNCEFWEDINGTVYKTGVGLVQDVILKNNSQAETPEVATMLYIASGLIAFALISKRRSRKSEIRLQTA